MRQDFGSLAASAGSVPAGMSHLASSVKTPKAVEIGMRGGVLEVPSAAPVICLWAFILAYIWTNRMGFFIRPTGPCQSIPVTSFPASSSNFPGTLPIHTEVRTIDQLRRICGELCREWWHIESAGNHEML
jgi:hypothetical protein